MDLGQLAEGVGDMKLASKLSPEDVPEKTPNTAALNAGKNVEFGVTGLDVNVRCFFLF